MSHSTLIDSSDEEMHAIPAPPARFAKTSFWASAPAEGIGTFGLEFVLPFFLMFVIMATTTDTSAVGLAVLFAGPISGASMNRSLAGTGPHKRDVDQPRAPTGRRAQRDHTIRTMITERRRRG